MLTNQQQERLQAGVALQLAARFGDASAVYERIRAESPNDFQINHLLGALRLQQGRAAEAVVFLDKARKSMPLSAPTLMCLGLALGVLGKHEAAEKALCTSVGLDPKSFENWSNLGALYVARGRNEEAIATFRRAVGLNPGYAPAWAGLGAALQLTGRNGEAIDCHNRALELDPQSMTAHFSRGQAMAGCQRLREAIADFEEQLKRRPDHFEARSFRLFLLNYCEDLSREALFGEHLAYGRAVEAGIAPRAFSNDPTPGRRLRIAFLSPDLRIHSIAYFLEPLLRHLDREQFEVLLYHDHHCVDPVTKRLRALGDVWRHIAGLSHQIVEETIRADAPDVLVDLAGHTGFNRLELIARRLAPVQITYLGYPNTTGLSAVDYRFTDSIADPAGATDHLHTESLVRFSPSSWVYQPPADAPEPAPAPSLANGVVTFGSFNAYSKVQPGALRIWRKLLAAVPGSRLVIKSSGLQPELHRSSLIEAGFSPDQVELLPLVPTAREHLASYAKLDVALDPFPYNGTTTTCEALWMGVPVVSLSGDRHAGRVGASLLTALGRPEWIAENPEDYVRIAAELALSPERGAWRRRMRAEMRRSALFDYAGHAEHFGAAVRSCWSRWCETSQDSAAAGAGRSASFP